MSPLRLAVEDGAKQQAVKEHRPTSRYCRFASALVLVLSLTASVLLYTYSLDVAVAGVTSGRGVGPVPAGEGVSLQLNTSSASDASSSTECTTSDSTTNAYADQSSSSELVLPRQSKMLPQGQQSTHINSIQTVSSFLPRFGEPKKDWPPKDPGRATIRVVKAKCGLIRGVVMKKWMPLARKEADGVYRTHIAAVGDSHGERLLWGIFEDLNICTPGSWRIKSEHILCEVPYSTICTESVFKPHFNPRRYPSLASGTELVFSYHKVPHSKSTVQTLATAYSPLFNGSSSADYEPLRRPGFSTDLYPIVRKRESRHYLQSVPGTWLSPSLKLRAPDVLYLTSGTWDVAHMEPVWDGYELYSHDVYARPDFDTYFSKILRDFGVTMRANYTEPLQALFKVWKSAWQEARFQSGNLAALELAYVPPRHVIVSVAPRVDCEGRFYKFGLRSHLSAEYNETHLDYRLFLRGLLRCSALVLPLEQVMQTVTRDTVHGFSTAHFHKPVPSPIITLLDWAVSANRCGRPDSTHMNFQEPRCREYIINSFYHLF